jgi:hypothetical protein
MRRGISTRTPFSALPWLPLIRRALGQRKLAAEPDETKSWARTTRKNSNFGEAGHDGAKHIYAGQTMSLSSS